MATDPRPAAPRPVSTLRGLLPFLRPYRARVVLAFVLLSLGSATILVVPLAFRDLIDAGFGTAYLARVVGEKKAREIWYWCRQYDAQEALQMGLVNKVVPPEQLLDEAKAWAAEIAAMSPTAIRFVKQSFNADTDHHAGLSNLSMSALDLYSVSPEGMEGANAFAEKRPPEFDRYVEWH